MRAGGVAVVLVAACAPATSPRTPTKPAALIAPARFRLVHDGDWQGRAHVDLGGGRVLWTGEHGERWVFRADGSTEGDPVPLLPESIVAALALPAGGFAFVGASGHTYLTEGALGVVREVRAPPHALRTITAGKAAILAITADDRLLRSTDAGSTWKPVAVGTDVVGWSAVALGPDGRGLLIGVPNRLLRTDDDGASFVRMPAKDLALTALWVSTRDDVVLDETLRLGLTGLDPAAGALRQPPWPTTAPTKTRWAWSGTRGFGVFVREQGYLVESTAAGTVHTRPLVLPTNCERMAIGAFEDAVELACKSHKQPLRLFRSTDAGKTFAEDGALDLDLVTPVVGADGAVLLPARCVAVGNEERCSWPHTRGVGGAWSVQAAAPFPLVGALERSRTHHVVLAVMKDSVVVARRAFDGATTVLAKLPGATRVAATDALVHADGARVWVAIASGPETLLFASDDGGKTFRAKKVPPVTSLAAWDDHLLLGVDGSLLESHDGGRTFARRPAPARTKVFACDATGCLTSRGARLGWDVGPETAMPVPPKRRRWATPLRCTPKTPWSIRGDGELPAIEGIDPTPDLLLAWPRRRAHDALDVVLEPRKGPSRIVPLLPGKPPPPFRWIQTTAHVQRDGVLAARFERGSHHTSLAAYDVDLALLPWGAATAQTISTTKTLVVSRLFPASLTLTSVAPLAVTPSYPSHPLLQLDGAGVWLGATDYLRPGAAPLVLPQQPLLAVLASPLLAASLFLRPEGVYVVEETGAFRVSPALGAPWTRHAWALGWPASTHAPLVIDGRLHVTTSFGGATHTPPAHFAVPLATTDEPGAFVSLPIPTDPPRACAERVGPRGVMPSPEGLSHPVLIEEGLRRELFLTTNAVTWGVAPGCVGALVAKPPDDDGSVAVIRPGALDEVRLYQADRAKWPNTISERTLSCSFDPSLAAHLPE